MKNLKKKLKDLFINLVEIDSPSGHEDEVSSYIKQVFGELGVDFEEDAFGNLLGRFKGEGESLLLSAHMDTVEPGRGIKARIEGDIIKSVGETILGADDKAGIAEILVLVEYLKKNKIKHRPIEIVFTREEEFGMQGVMNFDCSQLSAREGLVLDSSGETEIVVLASPYIINIDIRIVGKSAHAGKHPENGVSAIQIASESISKLELGRVDYETTANVGIIQGGEIRNGIPENVIIKAEIRSHSKDKMDEYKEDLLKVFEHSAEKFGGNVEFEYGGNCNGYCYQKNDGVIQKIEKAWEKVGRKPIYKPSCGASDANGFVEAGIMAVDVGYGAYFPHTTREYADLKEMEEVVKFMAELVRV